MFENVAGPIHVLISRSFDSNIVFLDCDEHKVLIDTGTGMYSDRLDKDLTSVGCSLAGITDVILTHSHIDHIGGVGPILKESSPVIYLHKSEAEKVNSGDMSLTLANTFGANLPPIHIDRVLEEGDVIDLGSIKLKVYSTPGHSSGSICLGIDDFGILVTGDTLFAGGSFGRVDFPTGDPKKLVKSLKRISEMDFNVAIPGHMGMIRHNATSSARSSYEMARSMFRV